MLFFDDEQVTHLSPPSWEEKSINTLIIIIFNGFPPISRRDEGR